MNADIFVDTDVLVYARDAAQGEKQRRAAAWMEALWASRRGRISVQVLQEFFVTVTQKLEPGLGRRAAREEVRLYVAWEPVVAAPEVLQEARRVQGRYRLSWWDAMIVGAAHTARCRWLLTEDLQDGQTIGGVAVVNPFSTAIDAIMT